MSVLDLDKCVFCQNTNCLKLLTPNESSIERVVNLIKQHEYSKLKLPFEFDIKSAICDSDIETFFRTNTVQWHKECVFKISDSRLERQLMKEISLRKCLICQSNDLNLITPSNDLYQKAVTDILQQRKSSATTLVNDFALYYQSFTYIVNFCERNHIKFHQQCADPSTLKKSTTQIREKRNSDKNVSSKTELLKNVCFICDTEGSIKIPLRRVISLDIDKKVRYCAKKNNNVLLLEKLSHGDLVASKSEYHLSCLTKLYRIDYTSKKTQFDDEDKTEEISNQALDDVVNFIEESYNSDNCVCFKFTNIYKMYKTNMENMGCVKFVHSTRLKENILLKLPKLKTQTAGKENILIFEEGLQEATKIFCNMKRAGTKYVDTDSEILKKAVKLMRTDLSNQINTFKGHLDGTCNEDNVPASVTRFINNLLRGVDDVDNQHNAVKSISQLIQFNYVSNERNKSVSGTTRHLPIRETPLPIYIALKIYATSRKRCIIDLFNQLGLCISYDRVQTINNQFANSVINHYDQHKIIGPSKFKQNQFTTGCVDNIDHNPTATTSKDSFHGTAISLNQHPTIQSYPDSHTSQNIYFDHNNTSNKLQHLPDEYTQVRPIVLVDKNIVIEKLNLSNLESTETGQKLALQKERTWFETLENVFIGKEINENISWSAHYANLLTTNKHISDGALLPLFYENAHTPAMIYHAMTIIKTSVNYYNPGQTPVIAMDQPLYALARQIQVNFKERFGEDKFVVMAGGLHILMAALSALGSLLDGSGWTNILISANITSEGRAKALLAASHVSRTVRCHQISLAALYICLRSAYLESKTNIEFDDWVIEKSSKIPIFKYWYSVMCFQVVILQFVKSIRTANFDEYVTSLKLLVPYFFIFDRIHYSRWLSVHLRDMVTLKERLPETYEHFKSGGFVVKKTENAFSCIALDQAHEQENAKIKGDGGAIGLTDNPVALRRWLIGGGEIANVISEYEMSNRHTNESKECSKKHHEQSPSLQNFFKNGVEDMVKVFNEYGNPFSNDSDELYAIHTKDVVIKKTADEVFTFEAKGQADFEKFYKERIVDCEVPILTPISKNNFLFYKAPRKTLSKNTKEKEIKIDASLYSRLYISSQNRDGDLENFFKHENHSYPPSISTYGAIRPSVKSDLLKCFKKYYQPSESVPEFESLILDGPVIVHFLDPKGRCSNFYEYIENIFMPYLSNVLKNVNRLDVVFDNYIANSLKQSCRVKRGVGVKKIVSYESKMPQDWKSFLENNENKQQLFELIALHISDYVTVSGKNMVSHVKNVSVYSRDSTIKFEIPIVEHEEADTRIFTHVVNCVKNGDTKIKIRTLDTDVVVLAIYVIKQIVTPFELWIEFGKGKDTYYLPVHSIAENLYEMARGLPFFHAFTGCDQVSSFKNHGKKTAWAVWNVFPEITDVFKKLSEAPAIPSDEDFELLERFIVLLYDRSSQQYSVNAARMELFSKGRPVDNIPPSSAALKQHILRSVYQGGIVWGSLLKSLKLPSPLEWGWKDENGFMIPFWTELKEAGLACQELIKCSCKKGCKTNLCKCTKSNLNCTKLCFCNVWFT